jgi:hypothetical protein
VNCASRCHLFVDGVQAGESPPASPIRLPPGHHVVKAIDLHSGKERTSNVTVKAGKAFVHTVRF